MANDQAVDEFLEHFGVKGMRWGVKKGSGTPRVGSSEDHVRATELKTQVKKSGTKSLSNDEFEVLLKRLGLETRYDDVSKKSATAGEKILNELLGEAKNIGKQEAKKYAQAHAGDIAKLLVGHGKHR
jgi:hypothetical protein